MARQLPRRPAPDPLALWQAVTAIASALEKVYSGLERCFLEIADEIDGQRPHGESWHADLIRQMRLPITGVRPALLDAATAELLDELRAFRHRERNLYGEELRRDKVTALLPKARRALRLTAGALRAAFARAAGPVRKPTRKRAPPRAGKAPRRGKLTGGR